MEMNIAAVRRKLLLLSMEPKEAVIEYINRAKSYNDDLAAMGAEENEKAMMGYIVNGLSKEWAADRPALICNPPANMTKLLEMLQALAISKEDSDRLLLEPQQPELQGNTAARDVPDGKRGWRSCMVYGQWVHTAYDQSHLKSVPVEELRKEAVSMVAAAAKLPEKMAAQGRKEMEQQEIEPEEKDATTKELGRGKREKKRNPKYVHLLMTPWKNLMPMPEGRSAVGVKWVFKIKTGDKGQLERFKARLVATPTHR
ncbi:hypothetical protein CLOP_g9669 [Closterium sp. NIES-67]|nr:hypothetical protein CLOP_g9669 [Closterium sp. NIES-67]